MKFVYTLLLGLLSVVASAQIDRTKLPEPGQARPIEIGNYETFTLKNGLKVYLIENHKLPRVTYRLQLDRLPILEGDKAGYLDMVGELMNRGTKTRTKDQINEEVDFIGANLSVGSQFAFASGLSKYNEKILELLADVVLNPVFPEEELDKIRKQTLSGIETSKDDPSAISGNVSAKVVYGAAHPYGEIATEETVNNITTEDIRTYYTQYYRPNIAYLAVVGDFNPKDIKKLVTKYFAGWATADVPTASFPAPVAPAKNVVALMDRPASVQSVINVTYPVDLKPGSPDEIPVRVLMEIFGGGFSSRLNMNLREDKGYTYGARGNLNSDRLITSFSAGASVRNEVTDSAIVQILDEMAGMATKGVTDEELELAKNTIAGNFARSLESPQTVATFAINTAIYQLPADYYATYLQKIQAVTKAQIQEMASKYIRPEAAHITVVGKGGDITAKLRPFGEIKYYDSFGEPVDPAAAKLPAGLTAEKVLDSYFAALGGKDKLKTVNTLQMSMTANVQGQSLNFVKVNKLPGKLNLTISMGGNVMSAQIYDGENAKVTQMGNTLPVDDATKAQLALEAYPFPELYFKEAGLKTKLTGVGQVAGKDAYLVEVENPSGKGFTLHFDAESGLLVRKSQTVEIPGGQTMTLNTDFTDYAEYDGIKFPKVVKIPLGPGFQAEAKLDSVGVNVPVEDKIFSVE